MRDGFPEARDLADLADAVRDLEVPDLTETIDSCLAKVRTALAELSA